MLNRLILSLLFHNIRTSHNIKNLNPLNARENFQETEAQKRKQEKIWEIVEDKKKSESLSNI